MNMRPFALPLILLFAMLSLMATLNWSTFTTPTLLSLGFTEVRAPLGVVMLAFTGVISALFVIYIVVQQAGVILAARRFAKEVQVQRQLANEAEASRFTELRAMLEGELRRIEAQGAGSTRELSERMAQSERVLQDKLAEAAVVKPFVAKNLSSSCFFEWFSTVGFVWIEEDRVLTSPITGVSRPPVRMALTSGFIDQVSCL